MLTITKNRKARRWQSTDNKFSGRKGEAVSDADSNLENSQKNPNGILESDTYSQGVIKCSEEVLERQRKAQQQQQPFL